MPQTRVARQLNVALLLSSVLLQPEAALPQSAPTESPRSASVSVRLPPLKLPNGDFELGPEVWGQSSSNGWPLIYESEELPFPPLNGSWGAWLGGDDHELSYLWQPIVVPAAFTAVTFAYFVASDETDCAYDTAEVVVDSVVHHSMFLCGTSQDWEALVVDISDHAGQIVELGVRVHTDGSFPSSFFMDDFYFINPLLLFDDGFEDGSTCAWSSGCLP